MATYPNEIYPAADLPLATPGATDSMVYVDEAGRLLRRGALANIPVSAAVQAELDEVRSQVFDGSPVYPNVAAGLSAVADGAQFKVEPSDPNIVAYSVYRRTGATANKVTDVPAAAVMTDKADKTMTGSIVTMGISRASTPNAGGFAQPDNVTIYANPIAADGQLFQIRCYARTRTTLRLASFSKDGSSPPVFTRAKEVWVPLVVGLNVIELDDLPEMVVNAGEYIGYNAPGVGVTSNSPGSNGGYYVGTYGATVAATNAEPTTNTLMQIGIDFGGVEETGYLLNAMSRNGGDGVFTVGKQGAFPASGLTAALDRINVLSVPAPRDGLLQTFRCRAVNAGTVRLYAVDSEDRQTFSTDVKPVSFDVQAGDNVIAMAKPFIVKKGQFVGFYGPGTVGYVSASSEAESPRVSFYSNGSGGRDTIPFTTTAGISTTNVYEIGLDFQALPNSAGVQSLGTMLRDMIDAVPDPTESNMVVSDSHTLWAWRAKLAGLLAGGNYHARILLTGDSWTDRPAIPDAVNAILRAEAQRAGSGWISVDGTYSIDGITNTRSGWTLYDASETGAPTRPTGIDGSYMVNSDGTGVWTVTGAECDAITIYHDQYGGSWSYAIDGGAAVTVTDALTDGSLGKTTISGLTYGPHSVTIQAISGTVVMSGMLATTARPGIELYKAGNAGISGARMDRITQYIAPIAVDFPPDVVAIVLGTNDYRLGHSVAGFTSCLNNLIEAYRGVSPDCAIIIVVPGRSNQPEVIPLSEFRDAARKVAEQQAVEYYSMYDEWGTYAQTSTLDLWADSLHLNAIGASTLARRLQQVFLG